MMQVLMVKSKFSTLNKEACSSRMSAAHVCTSAKLQGAPF